MLLKKPIQLNFDRNIVVTGGTGFIGTNIVKYLFKNSKVNIIVFDRTLKKDNMINNPRIIYHSANLEKEIMYKTLNKYDFGTLFHCGAISDTLYPDEDYIMKVNAESMFDIIKVCKNKKATLVYSSSASVYGNANKINIVTDKLKPETLYAKSKLAMELIAKQEHNKMKIIGLRYFNVYGPGEQYKGKMASMIHKMKNGHNVLFKYGEQKRDFVYVKDVVSANINAALYGTSGIYNVGSGTARSFNDIARILIDNGINLNIEYIDNPYNFYQNFTQADILETVKELKYYPKYNLEAGIANMMNII